jgi:hypothetical protein
VAYEYDRRTPRYSLVACIEMTDPLSEIQVRARTKMLSMSGCGVESSMLFTKGTIVRIKLSHHDAEVRAVGRVVYSNFDLGMGIAFTAVEREGERILQCWIAECLSAPIEKR